MRYQEIAHHLLAFLLLIIAARESGAHLSGGRRLAAVSRHIAAHLEEPAALQVPRLAGTAGLSESRFKAWFKQQTGVPPAEYVLRERVAEAARRLSSRRATVTEVAYSLGFSSSQYFASVFKRFTNRNPRTLLKARG